MRRILRVSTVLLSAVAVGVSSSAAVAVVTAGSSPGTTSEGRPTPDHGPPGTGRGENLLLVVVDSYATQAEASQRAGEISYGDVQGLYVAPSDAFSVLGVYEQTNAAFVSSSCDTPRPEDVHVCETGQFDRIRVHQEPRLRRLDGARWHAELDNRRTRSGGCARNDAPPCVADRFDQLLGEDGQLESGRWLLLSGFRTKLGAQQFLTSTQAARQEDAVVLRVRKHDDSDVGLGQEPHPSGNGPLVGPLDRQDSYQ
jgi:hypothetical protein